MSIPSESYVEGGAAPASPAPETSSPDVSAQIDPQQMQTLDQPGQPAASPAPQQPFWKTLLQGALNGLAGSAGARNWGQALGLGVRGEQVARQQQFENQMQQQQADQQAQVNAANIKFRDEQSAFNAAQLANMGHQLNIADQAARDAHDDAVMRQVEFGRKNGVTYTFVPGQQSMNHLTQQSANNPAGASVPSGSFVTSQGVWVPNTDDQNYANSSYDLLKTVGPYYGLVAPPRADFFGGNAKNREDIIKQLNFLMQGRNITGGPVDPKALDGMITNTQLQLKRAAADPNADKIVPALTNTLQMLQNAKQGSDAYLDDQMHRNMNVRAAGAVAGANARPVDATDANGNPVKVSWGDYQRGNGQGGGSGVPSAAPAGQPAASAPKYSPGNGEMFMGTLPDGSQVAGSLPELQAAGASNPLKMAADEAGKVRVARQAVAPNGLFHSVAQDIAALEQSGKLGTVASRWNDFMAGKVGNEPEFAKLRTDMGLLGTALMQAHVGARGGDDMREHFTKLADYRISDPATLRAALGREFNYVKEKAAFAPHGGK